MKKLLGILVLGLLLGGNAYAELLSFNCNRIDGSNSATKIKYIFDKKKNELTFDYYRDGERTKSKPNILDIDGTIVTYNFKYKDAKLKKAFKNYAYQFDYSKDPFIDYQIKPKRKASISCNK